MRILVVEDEHKIANSIKKGLEQEHFTVDVAYEGNDGLDLAGGEKYDAIVLDLMLPGIDGLTICRKIREGGNQVPILILTAKSQLEDKLIGLNTGADDYLVKPFAFAELVARLKALLRRPGQLTPQLLQVEDLKLDTSGYLVTRGEKKLNLSRKEFALLEYLMRHPGQILTKEQIIEGVWSYESDILPNTVEVYVKNLREKIDAPFSKLTPLLHTVRGFGYKISGKKD